METQIRHCIQGQIQHWGAGPDSTRDPVHDPVQPVLVDDCVGRWVVGWARGLVGSAGGCPSTAAVPVNAVRCCGILTNYTGTRLKTPSKARRHALVRLQLFP